jgi:hypothetical protein
MSFEPIKIVAVVGLFLLLVFYPSKGLSGSSKNAPVVTVTVRTTGADSLDTVCAKLKMSDVNKCKESLLAKCAAVFSKYQYCERVARGGRGCLLHLQQLEQCLLKKS